MVYKSVSGFAAGALLERSAFSYSSTPSVDSRSTSSKHPCFRALGSLVSPFEFGLRFSSSQRLFISPAWCATKLPQMELPMAPINKCALSLILSPPVSSSDSGESVRSIESRAIGTSPTSTTAFSATSNKAALSFILSSLPVSLIEHDSFTRTPPISTRLNRKCVRSTAYKSTTRRSTWSYSTQGSPPPQQSSTATSGPDCINAISGIATKKSTRFCEVNGCMKLSKHNKRCWRHGGSIKCQVADCDNRAKSKGVCWSHGGGTLCSFEGCDTISVSRGCCWAHGGGKRCLLPDCVKPAYERTKNYCKVHYKAIVTHCTE